MRFVMTVLSLVYVAIGPLPAQAQSYPSDTVFIVAPFPPGGTTDLLARDIAARMSTALGATVVVDNRAGGSGIVGTEYVARARPDGHRLLMAGSPHSINNSLRRNVPYDPVRDFEPIALLLTLPQIMVVHPSLPVSSVAEFLDHGRRNPNAIKCGVVPAGSSELAVAMLVASTGAPILQVPYRGDAPTITDLVAGHINCFIGIANQVLPHVRDGRLRAIAVTSNQRLDVLPDLPTMIEAGVPNFEASSWNGVFAPAGTPRAVLDRLESALVGIARDPSFRARWVGMGAIVPAGGRETLQVHLAAEIARWRRVIEVAGIRAD